MSKCFKQQKQIYISAIITTNNNQSVTAPQPTWKACIKNEIVSIMNRIGQQQNGNNKCSVVTGAFNKMGKCWVNMPNAINTEPTLAE